MSPIFTPCAKRSTINKSFSTLSLSGRAAKKPTLNINVLDSTQEIYLCIYNIINEIPFFGLLHSCSLIPPFITSPGRESSNKVKVSFPFPKHDSFSREVQFPILFDYHFHISAKITAAFHPMGSLTKQISVLFYNPIPTKSKHPHYNEEKYRKAVR